MHWITPSQAPSRPAHRMPELEEDLGVIWSTSTLCRTPPQVCSLLFSGFLSSLHVGSYVTCRQAL